MQQRELKKSGGNYLLIVNGENALCPFQASFNRPKARSIQGGVPEMENVRYGCGSTCPLFEVEVKDGTAAQANVTINCGCAPIRFQGVKI